MAYPEPERVSINWTPPESRLLEEMHLSFDAAEPLTNEQLEDLYDYVIDYLCIDKDGNFVGPGETANDIQNKLIDVMRPRGLL